MEIKKVWVIHKTHLDIGFTDSAAAVLDRYLNTFIPGAIATARACNQGGKKNFVWTVGSFLIQLYLEQGRDPGLLEQAIRERDEARLAAEAAQADAKSAEESRAKMEADMALLKEQCRSSQDAVAAAQKELEELKAKPVDVAVMAVDQEKLDAARAEAVAEMQAKVDKAKAARDKAEENRKAAEAALAEIRTKLEEAGKAERKAAIAGDSDLAVFQLLFGQAQEIANKLHGLFIKAKGREDEGQAAGMQKALSKLAELIGKAAEV